MDCLKHKKEVAGISDMKMLAEMIGDLHYESLTELMKCVALKLYKDGRKDISEGRTRLGFHLMDAGENVAKTYENIKNAWQISKPFMESK